MSQPSIDRTGDNTLPVGVILPAAGFGARMGSSIPKQYLELAGEPVLIRTIRSFLDCTDIDLVVIAVAADQRQHMQTLLAGYLSTDQQEKVIIATGGATRQLSVKAGFDAMPARMKIILVHDGARPLISSRLIRSCIKTVIARGAAIAAIPVNDTIKRVNADKSIGKTIDRSNLYAAQTPQGAHRHLFEQAYRVAERDGFTGTDEASLFEHAGIAVAVVEGEERNIKITRPGDLRIARGLLGGDSDMLRIGHGFDAHRLVADRPLVLGGEPIDYHLGLLGHSDADVVIHALIDAILGAMAAGDIGSNFPDTDDAYKGINSMILLEKIIGLTIDNGYTVVNADLTILCQAPKLAPYLKKMRHNLSRVCNIPPDCVGIKATTTEKMGYIGRGEGISTHATVLLKKKSPETI